VRRSVRLAALDVLNHPAAAALRCTNTVLDMQHFKTLLQLISFPICQLNCCAAWQLSFQSRLFSPLFIILSFIFLLCFSINASVSLELHKSFSVCVGSVAFYVRQTWKWLAKHSGPAPRFVFFFFLSAGLVALCGCVCAWVIRLCFCVVLGSTYRGDFRSPLTVTNTHTHTAHVRLLYLFNMDT